MSEDPHEKYVAGYEAGYLAGFAKGLSDGEGRGYSDAKHRAYLAIAALADHDVIPRAHLDELRDSLRTLIGKPS